MQHHNDQRNNPLYPAFFEERAPNKLAIEYHTPDPANPDGILKGYLYAKPLAVLRTQDEAHGEQRFALYVAQAREKVWLENGSEDTVSENSPARFHAGAIEVAENGQLIVPRSSFHQVSFRIRFLPDPLNGEGNALVQAFTRAHSNYKLASGPHGMRKRVGRSLPGKDTARQELEDAFEAMWDVLLHDTYLPEEDRRIAINFCMHLTERSLEIARSNRNYRADLQEMSTFWNPLRMYLEDTPDLALRLVERWMSNFDQDLWKELHFDTGNRYLCSDLDRLFEPARSSNDGSRFRG